MTCSILNDLFDLDSLEFFLDNLVIEGVQDDFVSLGTVKRSGPFEHAHNNFITSVLRHKLCNCLDFVDQDFVQRGTELWELLEALEQISSSRNARLVRIEHVAL
jgi:hypothetical protein